MLDTVHNFFGNFLIEKILFFFWIDMDLLDLFIEASQSFSSIVGAQMCVLAASWLLW